MSGVIGRTIAGADIVNALVNGGIVLPQAVLPPADGTGLTVTKVNALIAAAIAAGGTTTTPNPTSFGGSTPTFDGQPITFGTATAAATPASAVSFDGQPISFGA